MRKLLLSLAVALASLTGAQAQEEGEFYALGNRIGIGVGVGTEGIGIDAATCLTKYCSVRLGVNIMPDINFTTDVDVAGVDRFGSDFEGTMEAKASLKRTTVDLKFDCYPFPDASSFFVTAGFSFGGSKIIKITGHSDEFAQMAQQGADLGIDIDEYRIPINENGDAEGGVKVNGFRPYLGLGFGRLIPKGRVGCRFELGVQFHGKPEVYAEGVDDLQAILEEEAGDDISELMDKLTVYPVLKFSIRGRIL